MRPIKLRLNAFGSFAGTEEVDFESLAPVGLFVVSGDTGTGKTTIFDAMCWALYGEMPLKDTDSVRSHHVTDEVCTWVEFTFESGGDRYLVSRNPKQFKPSAKSKRLVTQEAAATLVRLDNGGTTPIATKVTDVGKACQQLVGLDADQFKRVVLLPQGEFSNFLLANSADRESLLRTLFGGEIYDNIVDELGTRRKDLEGDIKDIDAQLNASLNTVRQRLRETFSGLGLVEPEHIDNLDIDQLRNLADSAVKPISELGEQVSLLAETARQASAAREQAVAAADRFKRATKHREDLQALDDVREKIEEQRIAANASAEARPVVDAAAHHEKTCGVVHAAKTAHDEILERITSELAALGITIDQPEPSAVATAVEKARDANEQQFTLISTLDQSTANVNSATEEHERALLEVETISAELAADEQRLGELQSALVEMRISPADPQRLDDEIKATRKLIQTRSTLDDLTPALTTATEQVHVTAERYRSALMAFIASEIPRLAETLEDGTPCPVCGSPDHPDPAKRDTDPVQPDDLQAEHDAHETALAREQQLKEEVAGLAAQFGTDEPATLEELNNKLTSLTAELEKALEAVRELERVDKECSELAVANNELGTRLALATQKAEHGAEVLAEARSALGVATVAASGIDRAKAEEARSALVQLDETIPKFQQQYDSLRAAETTAQSTREQLANALSTSRFTSVEEAQEHVIPKDDETTALDAAEKHKEQTSETTSALRELENLGIPHELPDIEILNREVTSSEDIHRKVQEAHISVIAALKSANQELDAHQAHSDSSASIRETLESVRKAHMVCNGNGATMPVSLKRWVLARELDRVTAAANVHLSSMTNGRFALRRPEQQTDKRRAFGLDLEVTDSDTGRPRSTNSLSGGEQFQASLALALGLKDIVSQGGTASGQRYEALFIDEGFGSLSADALDDAVQTLEHLQARGHMVGAITHVETMKQMLHVGIEVRRCKNGNGSTLTVHP